MGNGASCTKVEQFDESVQMPSISPIKRSSTSLSFGPPYRRLYTKNPLRPPLPPPPPPPPIVVEEEPYTVKKNADQYSSVWDSHAKLSPAFNRPLVAEFSKPEHHQKETMNTKWSKKTSTNVDSTNIESVLSTQTHSCINLSTSEKVDDLIKSLNRIHTQLDDTIKRRTQQISAETESVLAHIVNETQGEQQRLLNYAKAQQTKQEEHYRELLQDYIAQLDEMKAKDLTELQNELQDCREQILHVSQMKIMNVNEQANIMKSKVVKEEQHQASSKIDTINIQLQSLSTDETFQQFGTEMITRTSVTTNTNVGKKADGQRCTFEVVDDVPVENNNDKRPPQQVQTKTTYSEVKYERQEPRIQTGRKSSTNSRSEVEEQH